MPDEDGYLPLGGDDHPDDHEQTHDRDIAEGSDFQAAQAGADDSLYNAQPGIGRPSPRFQRSLEQQLDAVLGEGRDFVAAELIDIMLASATSMGLFAILHDVDAATSMHSAIDHESPGARSPIELAFALIAMGLETARLPSDTAQERELLVDTLRIEFLKRIPTLAWKDANLGLFHCVALILASHTWSLQPQLTDLADRWNIMAKLIWDQVSRSRPEHHSAESMRRIGGAIQIQTVTCNLLYGTLVPLQPGSTGASNHYFVRSPGSARSYTVTIDEYFNLFIPLVEPLQQTLRLENPDAAPTATAQIRDSLELYYTEFPKSLLEFKNLTCPYQAEAMIWLHGIFILTYVRRDLPGLLLDKTLLLDPAFCSAFEHALLISEILPTLLSLDPFGSQLSGGTVFIVLLSAMVTASCMWQHHIQAAGCARSTSLAEHPNALEDCILSHLGFLDVLRARNSRYDQRLINAVHQCLSTVHGALDDASHCLLAEALRELAHYRSGVRRSHVTEREDHEMVEVCALVSGAAHQASSRPVACQDWDEASDMRGAIAALCDPVARICQEGFFDLAIQYM